MNEELRWVKKRDGAHRPGSRGTPGYDRDLWQGDGNNATQGPSESRPAHDVLAELDTARADLDTTRADLDRTRADLKAERARGVAQAEKTWHAEQPDQEESLFVRIVAASLEGLIEGVAEALENPEVRRALGTAARDAGSRATGWLRSVFRRQDRNMTEVAVLTEPPPSTQAEALSELEGQESGDEGPTEHVSSDEYRQRLLTALAMEEAASRLKQSLLSVRVDDEELPSELHMAIDLALAGNAAQLPAHSRSLLLEFLADADYLDDPLVAIPNLPQPQTGQRRPESLI